MTNRALAPARRRFASWLDRHLGAALVAPVIAVLAAFAFYPVAGSFWLSLHGTILSLPQHGEPFVGLGNYRDLASGTLFWRSLATTLAFVAASTALETVLGLAVALCLHASFRGRSAVRAAVLVPWAVPTVVASQMWRFLLNDRYGPVSYFLFHGATPLAAPGGALAAVIAADVWKTTPFAALILLAGLQMIPQQLDEAAAIDGAGRIGRFLYVTLPLLRPALVVVVLFRTIDAFRVFDLVFVMTQGGPADATDVLQYLGYRRSFSEGLMGSGAAVSTVVFLLSLAVSIFYVRAVGSDLWRGQR
jgi:multiple sugar transport system permease protein